MAPFHWLVGRWYNHLVAEINGLMTSVVTGFYSGISLNSLIIKLTDKGHWVNTCYCLGESIT